MWEVLTTDSFDLWFDELDDTDRSNVLASLLVLEQKGPHLSRPHAGTVKGSAHNNIKELRVQSKGKPIRAFLRLIPEEMQLFCVHGTKQVMRNASTKRCCQLRMLSLGSTSMVSIRRGRLGFRGMRLWRDHFKTL